jgi:hypothetical protein
LRACLQNGGRNEITSGRKIKSDTYENDIDSSPDSRVGTPQLRVKKGEMIKRAVGRASASA